MQVTMLGLIYLKRLVRNVIVGITLTVQVQMLAHLVRKIPLRAFRVELNVSSVIQVCSSGVRAIILNYVTHSLSLELNDQKLGTHHARTHRYTIRNECSGMYVMLHLVREKYDQYTLKNLTHTSRARTKVHTQHWKLRGHSNICRTFCNSHEPRSLVCSLLYSQDSD